MPDVQDINEEKQWFYQERAKLAVTGLQKRNISTQFAANSDEALSVILGMIPEGLTVARGDSLTIDRIGVMSELKRRHQNVVIDPYEIKPDGQWAVEGAEREKMEREALLSDIFLTGMNAVTVDGKLVSTDGHGNRVAAMIFGPAKVIVVVGANKIVTDVPEALQRINQYCAPVNAKRHFLKHNSLEMGDLPCVKTGKCVDCRHDQRICNYTVIIEGQAIDEKDRINVVLVGEELGI